MTVALRVVLALALMSVAAYGVCETRRWRDSEIAAMISKKQKRLRAWGFFFLILVLGLWLRGTFLPTPHTKRALANALAYWMLTVLAAVPLIPLALLDARENLYRALRDRRELRESTLTVRTPSESEP